MYNIVLMLVFIIAILYTLYPNDIRTLFHSLYPNFAPHSGQNLEVPSVLVPQLVQNLCIPVKEEVNDDAEAEEVDPTAIACSANAKARSSREDCSTKPHIWVMSTGQKKSMEMTVGIAC